MPQNVVEIVIKTTDHTKAGIDSVEKSVGGLKHKLAEVSGQAAGFLAANVVAKGFEAFKGFIDGSIEAASNLGESVNAVQQVFGPSQDAILGWGRSNAAAFGLSQRAFNELVTPLGAGLKNAGLSLQDTSKWTIDLTKRASDMASVFNTSVPDALEAIQAGLRGEADPLERYGVGISAARVQTEALAETHRKSAKDLTTQELAIARLNLIMKQTSSTQGDFARTSGGLANATRIQQARMEDLQAQIGAKLLPAQLLLVQAENALADVVANKVIPVIEAASGWISDHRGLILAVAIGIVTALVPAFIAWATAAGTAAVATLAATWPLIAIGAAVAALAAAFIYAYQHSETFRTVVDATVGWLTGTALPAVAAFGKGMIDAFRSAATFSVQAFRFLADAVLAVFGSIVNGAATALGWVPGIGPKLTAAAGAFNRFRDQVNNALDGIQRTVEPTVTLNTSGFYRQVGGVLSELAYVRGQQVYIPVNASSANFRESRTAAKAGGGIVGAAGGGTRSGWVLVGEHGAELVDLAAGSTVHSNPDTQRMLSEHAATSGGRPAVIEIVSAGGRLNDLLLEILRESIRVRGGNVQIVLGRS